MITTLPATLLVTFQEDRRHHRYCQRPCNPCDCRGVVQAVLGDLALLGVPLEGRILRAGLAEDVDIGPLDIGQWAGIAGKLTATSPCFCTAEHDPRASPDNHQKGKRNDNPGAPLCSRWSSTRGLSS